MPAKIIILFDMYFYLFFERFKPALRGSNPLAAHQHFPAGNVADTTKRA